MNRRSFISLHGANITNVDGCVLCADAETKGPQEIPARADARTAFSLQSRLRRVRQNPISGPHFEPPPHSRTMLDGGGGMRDPTGCNPGINCEPIPMWPCGKRQISGRPHVCHSSMGPLDTHKSYIPSINNMFSLGMIGWE